jgi:hypothetical protein
MEGFIIIPFFFLLSFSFFSFEQLLSQRASCSTLTLVSLRSLRCGNKAGVCDEAAQRIWVALGYSFDLAGGLGCGSIGVGNRSHTQQHLRNK